MRIDKFLSNAGAGSRSQVKTDLKKGLVLVNGQAVRNADFSSGSGSRYHYVQRKGAFPAG